MLQTPEVKLFFAVTHFNPGNWLAQRKIIEEIKNRRLEILIIDDRNKFRNSMADLLRRKYGASVTEVDTGQAGVDLVKGGDVFNIIFLDLFMPVMNGLATHHELRKFDRSCRLVIMSAYPGSNEWNQAKEMDLEVVRKPISPSTLMSILREL